MPKFRQYAVLAMVALVDEDATYCVYEKGGIGGEDGIVIHTGDDIDSSEDVDISDVINAGVIAALQHRLATSNLPIVGRG